LPVGVSKHEDYQMTLRGLPACADIRWRKPGFMFGRKCPR